VPLHRVTHQRASERFLFIAVNPEPYSMLCRDTSSDFIRQYVKVPFLDNYYYYFIIVKAKIIATLYIKNVTGALYTVNYNENTSSSELGKLIQQKKALTLIT